MNQQDIKELTLEVLKDTPLEADLRKAFALYEKAQNVILSLNSIGDPQDLTLTKIGTVLSLNLFGILCGGKKPNELTQEDWESIAKEVMDKAILMDGQSYSMYVFDLYADYIGFSAEKLKSKVPDDKRRDQIDAISALSDELKSKKQQLLDGKITEVAYTEDCLWISLEAMMKCMATYVGCFTGEQYSELILAVSSLAFEYGRLVLYRKEQALLEEYIRNQYLLDEQMQVKFDAFKRELQEESDRFNALVADAFDPNYRNSLMGSVELARAAGVREEEILKTVEDIDGFFLN